ncbi:MAG: tetratricopeptide repeat protein [bacterium]
MEPFDGEGEVEELIDRAHNLLQINNPEEALEILAQAEEKSPNNGWVQLFRGSAYGQMERQEEAVDEILKAADSNLDDIDIQVESAHQLSYLQHYQDALISANRAIKLDSHDAGAYMAQADAMEQLGRINEALVAREDALALEPEDQENLYYYALDLCDVGRFHEAFKYAELLYNKMDDDPDILRLYGATLSYLARHSEAIAIWDKLEELEGETGILLYNRATSLDAIGLSEEAQTLIEKAIDLEPDVAVNHLAYGTMLERAGKEEQAITEYLTTLELDDEVLEAALRIVDLAIEIDAVAPALESIEEMLKLKPDNAILIYVQGRLMIESSDVDIVIEGEQKIELAANKQPKLSVAWFSLAKLYHEQNRFDEALRAIERATGDYGDDASLWVIRALSYVGNKKYVEAMECFDKACELDPGDEKPWLYMGRMLMIDLNRSADARNAFLESLHRRPDNPEAMWMLALCHLRVGDMNDASDVVNRLLKVDPFYVRGLLVRAALRAQTGKITAAFADLRAAMKLGYDTTYVVEEPLFAPLWNDPRMKKLNKYQI